MSFFQRKTVNFFSYVIPKNIAFLGVKFLLRSQGIGWASPVGGVKSSGEISFLKNCIKNINNPCIFDVGAHTGMFTYELLLINPNSFVHCFEPSRPHFKVIKAKFRPCKNIFLNNCGLSHLNEKRVLFKDKKITGLASLIKINYDQYGINLNYYEKVQTIVGDEYIEKVKIKKIDYLKIDVEGWELNVLKGLEKSFSKKIIKVCQFEFGYGQLEQRRNFRDFYNFFNGYSYKIGIIKPNGRLNLIPKYDEFYENYYASNFVAFI